MLSQIVWPALILGAAAALSVGPIFVTILQSALTSGFPAGMRVIMGSALADLILVVPALAFTWLVAGLARAALWTGLAGAVFLCALAVQASYQARRLWRREAMITPVTGWALGRGLLGNLTSPATWSFWIAVGTPTMLHAERAGGASGLVLFLVIWFVTAAGLEAALALAVARSRHRVGARGLAVLNASAAAFFLVLAVLLVARDVAPRLAS
ncbi:MAG: LysE family translocator [Gemmatimonadota bacterium]